MGDKTRLQGSNIEISEGVDKVVAVTESYKLVNKKFHPEDSIVPVGNTHIGPGTMTVIAGPCAIESKEQLMEPHLQLKSRRHLPAGRRIQAPHLSLLLPGSGRRRTQVYEGSQGSHRS